MPLRYLQRVGDLLISRFSLVGLTDQKGGLLFEEVSSKRMILNVGDGILIITQYQGMVSLARFNRWLKVYSRCETQMAFCHIAFQPVVEVTLTV